MEYKNKNSILQEAKEIILLLDSNTDQLTLLRVYNKWYTSGLEFVKSHTESRLGEFESLHFEIQKALCDINPDLKLVRLNLIILSAIIEGSQDHTPFIVF